MKKWLVATFLLCGASLSAQEKTILLLSYAQTTVADTASPNPAPNQKNPLLKSENKAFNLSLWCTVLPTLTLIGSPFGLIAGPSIGYFYGGVPGRGWFGIGIRTVGVGGMISSFAICGWDCGPGDSNYGLAWLVFGTGGAIVLGDIIYDLATVKKAVRKHNRSLQKTGWMLVPVYLGEHNAGGLQLRVTF